MAGVPERLVLQRHRDLVGRGSHVWWRRGLLALVGAFVVLGALNVFGQRPATTHARAATATLDLYAPSRVRSGLLYEARFTILARRGLKNALLLLSSGWGEGHQMNTIEPSPVAEASRDGQFLFTLGHIRKGARYRLFMQFQANPTNVSWRRPANVALYDSGRLILRLRHTLTVYP
jgi:hypothetical protein